MGLVSVRAAFSRGGDERLPTGLGIQKNRPISPPPTNIEILDVGFAFTSQQPEGLLLGARCQKTVKNNLKPKASLVLGRE